MFRKSRFYIGMVFLSVTSLLFAMSGSVQTSLAATLQPVAAVQVCPGPVAQGYVRCFSRVIPNASSTPTGLSPATVISAYNFPTSLTAGAGMTIAIVDAYNNPYAESDLGVFSSTFRLPVCTTANGCF